MDLEGLGYGKRKLPWKARRIFLGSGEDQGFSFVALEFTKDGKVDFPTKIGFVPPEFIYWNFNEEQQRIEFLNEDRNPKVFAGLPKIGVYGARVIDFADGNGMLVNFFDYGVETNVPVTQRGFLYHGHNLISRNNEYWAGWDTIRIG